MTFLNPLVLFGLVAAGIPLILHLLNLRKLRTIEFSTLTFLKELQQTKIRRLKLRQLLLLLVRTLLIVTIIFAFARPALRGTMLSGIGSQAHSTVVYIIDDSYSLAPNDEYGQRFKQAKDATLKLVDLLKEGDEAFLIKLSDLPKATIEPAIHDFSALRTVINEAQLSFIRRPMEDALRTAARLLALSNNVNKEVYIISDMQRTLFYRYLDSKEEKILSLFGPGVVFFTIDIGKNNISNAAVDSLEVTSKILEKGKPIIVKTWIRNIGDIPLKDYVVSVYLDGVRSAQRSISVDAVGSAVIEFSVTPKRIGFMNGYVELEHDNIEQDNRRYFTIHIPEQILVGLVSTAPADAQYLLLALRSSNIDTQQAVINIQQATTQKFPLLDLTKIDVLCLSNVTSFGTNDVDRIARFVENGGGLILFAGNDIQIELYNSTLLSTLRIPPIFSIQKVPNETTRLSFKEIDINHPLFSTLFDYDNSRVKQKDYKIESPSISTILRRQTGKLGHTIIGLNDGNPLLSEHSFGKGKILFYSLAPTLWWSDFPLKAIFAPLMYRSIIYSASRDMVSSTFITGEDGVINIHQARQTIDHQYNIISPNGIGELIQPSQTTGIRTGFGSSLTFQLKRFELPGCYDLKSTTATLSSIAVNTDNRESDTRKVSEAELNDFWNRMNIPTSSVRSIDQAGPIQATVLESRFGVELWKYCIAIALLLALVEMLIARDGTKATQQAPA